MKRMLNKATVFALLYLAWKGIFSHVGTGIQAGLFAFCLLIILVMLLVDTSEDDADDVSG